MKTECVEENAHQVYSMESSRKEGCSVAYLAQGPTYKTPNKYLGVGYEAEGGNECPEGQRKTLISGINTCVSYEGITMGLRGKRVKDMVL